ncbi:hypothetical protein [Halobellus rarus]|uniref:Uncharacterized protein n=1 Tax=Halobellus rarus TaxID=1126237 RepID=A0ABD6CN78_9EURY|nr:hypothetical protein [Halobellus rarus]
MLRDALKHPDFNRADLKATLTGEVEIQEGRTHSSDEIEASLDTDDSDSAGDE